MKVGLSNLSDHLVSLSEIIHSQVISCEYLKQEHVPLESDLSEIQEHQPFLEDQIRLFRVLPSVDIPAWEKAFCEEFTEK